jgi:hypothetical protein
MPHLHTVTVVSDIDVEIDGKTLPKLKYADCYMVEVKNLYCLETLRTNARTITNCPKLKNLTSICCKSVSPIEIKGCPVRRIEVLSREVLPKITSDVEIKIKALFYGRDVKPISDPRVDHLSCFYINDIIVDSPVQSLELVMCNYVNVQSTHIRNLTIDGASGLDLYTKYQPNLRSITIAYPTYMNKVPIFDLISNARSIGPASYLTIICNDGDGKMEYIDGIYVRYIRDKIANFIATPTKINIVILN